MGSWKAREQEFKYGSTLHCVTSGQVPSPQWPPSYLKMGTGSL